MKKEDFTSSILTEEINKFVLCSNDDKKCDQMIW